MADTYDAELFYRDGRAMARYPDGEEVLLADVMRYMNPGTEFDDATGSQMAATPPRADAPGFAVSPPEEDRFGATAAYMAEPYFADAGAIMSEAGQRPTYFTDPVLGNVERAGQYLGDAGMAGLNALGGAVYGGAGLLGDIFGGTPQQERRLARDIAGGTDVAGVGPELRIVDALRRGGPSLLDFATDAGKAAAPTARQFMRADEGGLRLYHGSPHSFDKFSMDKIGTGEGAQAYGHGLYFAENEGVARGYRDALSARAAPNDARGNAFDLVQRMGGDETATAEILRDAISSTPSPNTQQFLSDTLRHIENKTYADFERPLGSMYEVNVNAKPETFLDSDLPLNKQPQSVRDALQPVIAGLKDARMNEFDRKAILSGKASGADLYSALKYSAGNADAFGSAAAATEAIRSKGIPGIRYLDAGSRNFTPTTIKETPSGVELYWGNDPRPVDIFSTRQAAEDAARQFDTRSRNYVIFDENLINIVRKYGIAGAAAMLGMSQADVAQAMGQQPQGLLGSGPQ